MARAPGPHGCMTTTMFGSREKRRALKFAVRTRLIPHIYSLGFERPHTKAVRPRWPEYLLESTYGRMRGPNTDFLDIYWDKYGAPKFKFFLNSGPTESMRHGTAWKDYTNDQLLSGYYGLPWGLLGYGGVWFGPGQSADAAVNMAIRAVSEWDEIVQRGDAAALAILQKRGFLERSGPGGWWLRHVKTDLPQAAIALNDWIDRLNGSGRR